MKLIKAIVALFLGVLIWLGFGVNTFLLVPIYLVVDEVKKGESLGLEGFILYVYPLIISVLWLVTGVAFWLEYKILSQIFPKRRNTIRIVLVALLAIGFLQWALRLLQMIIE